MDTRKIKRIAAVFVLALFATILILLATIDTGNNNTYDPDINADDNVHIVKSPSENDPVIDPNLNEGSGDDPTDPTTDKETIDKVTVTEEICPESLRAIAEKYNVIGMSAVVIENGQISHVYSYGTRNTETGEPFNSSSVLRTASVSGLISAIGVMKLSDEGIIDIDEPIGNYLGYTVVNPYNNKQITLRQILTHTASISDYGAYDKVTNNELEYQTLKEMLNGTYAESNFFNHSPGYKYAYSNFGGAIISAVASAATQKSFNDYMTEEIFEPLNIDASYLSTGIKARENISNIYRQGKISYSLESMDQFSAKLMTIAPVDNYRYSHANLFINAKDLSRIARMLMNGGEVDRVRILSQEAVDEMLSTEANGSLYKDVGYGLYISKYDDLVEGRTLYGQQGGAYGATTEIFFDLEDKSGIVLLVNGSSNAVLDNGISAMGSAVINELYSSVIGK